MPDERLESLYLKLVRFLAAQEQLQTPQSREYLIRASGIGDLLPQIDLNGAPENVASGMIGAVARQGQVRMVQFLDGLDEGLYLGVEDRALLAALRASAANLSSEQWQRESRMEHDEPQDQPSGRRQLDTGGGAFVAGSVHTGGGAFVGRDQIVTTGPVATGGSAITMGSGAAVAGSRTVVITGGADGKGSPADFQVLLAELRRQVAVLQTQGLTATDGADATSALDQAAELARRAEPPGKRIVRALEDVKDILTAADGALAASATLMPMVNQAIRMAQSSFAH